MAKLTGRCRCGAIRWRAPGPVLWSGFCHCDSCRRASSAPLTAFFGVARNSVEWSGDLAFQQSSPDLARGYCGACGSQMTIRSDRWPEEAHLFAATLDNPAEFQPAAHFHWGEKLPWLSIADDLPKYAASADNARPLDV